MSEDPKGIMFRVIYKKENGGVPTVGQGVKNLALPQLWLGFYPWPGHIHVPRVQPFKKILKVVPIYI